MTWPWNHSTFVIIYQPPIHHPTSKQSYSCLAPTVVSVENLCSHFLTKVLASTCNLHHHPFSFSLSFFFEYTKTKTSCLWPTEKGLQTLPYEKADILQPFYHSFNPLFCSFHMSQIMVGPWHHLRFKQTIGDSQFHGSILTSDSIKYYLPELKAVSPPHIIFD